MKIVADKDLPLVEELFSNFGELLLLPGRSIENKHLINADALLVRSATKVSKELLVNTPLKFEYCCDIVSAANFGFVIL